MSRASSCSVRGPEVLDKRGLFWIVVSVVLSLGLTLLVNLVLLLFSGGGVGINV